MRKSKVIAALSALAVGIAAIIPFTAHALFAFLGWVFTAMGGCFTLLSAWFAKASDEPHEKAMWGLILLFLTAAMIYAFGLPLLKYWPLLAVVAIVFGIAAWNAKRKMRRKRTCC